jgi:hypothetical protein
MIATLIKEIARANERDPSLNLDAHFATNGDFVNVYLHWGDEGERQFKDFCMAGNEVAAALRFVVRLSEGKVAA